MPYSLAQMISPGNVPAENAFVTTCSDALRLDTAGTIGGTGPAGPVVVAGSLYLVGEVRARIVDDPALRDG